MSGIEHARARLQCAWETLLRDYESVRTGWRDDTALRFEQHYWPPYAQTIEAALKQMTHFAELTDKCHRELD